MEKYVEYGVAALMMVLWASSWFAQSLLGSQKRQALAASVGRVASAANVLALMSLATGLLLPMAGVSGDAARAVLAGSCLFMAPAILAWLLSGR